MPSNFVDRLLKKVNLNEEILPGELLIEVLGKHRVLVENHSGVICYSSTEIKIRSKNGDVCVCGCDLILDQMTKYKLIIIGRISNICFG